MSTRGSELPPTFSLKRRPPGRSPDAVTCGQDRVSLALWCQSTGVIGASDRRSKCKFFWRDVCRAQSGGDVEITELVDRNRGVHVVLPNAVLGKK